MVDNMLFKLYWLKFDISLVVVVGPTPPAKNGGGVQQPFLRTPANSTMISPI